jgi:DNA-binding response OmpR family regulator
VLFMSGYEQQGATAEGWPDPAAQIIGKPFSRAALLARVTQMLTADADASASELPGQRVRSERSQQGHRTLAERW